jgi:hypothetical protein
MSLQLRPILIAAFICSVASTAWAETPKTTQIYLQRGADGRSVLTDRPSASAVTERTWQMDREDPVAAQQRAMEVQRQADAVTLRVQRAIEAQQRRASEETLMRLRLAQLERQYSDAAGDDDGDAVVFAPIGFRPYGNNRRPPHRPHPSMRPMALRGSASLGSR